jgi:hypothetical protein
MKANIRKIVIIGRGKTPRNMGRERRPHPKLALDLQRGGTTRAAVRALGVRLKLNGRFFLLFFLIFFMSRRICPLRTMAAGARLNRAGHVLGQKTRLTDRITAKFRRFCQHRRTLRCTGGDTLGFGVAVLLQGGSS